MPPFVAALDHVLAVAEQACRVGSQKGGALGMLIGPPQRHQCPGHLHDVVRGPISAAAIGMDLDTVLIDNEAPAAGTGVRLASAVAVNQKTGQDGPVNSVWPN